MQHLLNPYRLKEADPEQGLFLTKLYGEGRVDNAAENLSLRRSDRFAGRGGAG